MAISRGLLAGLIVFVTMFVVATAAAETEAPDGYSCGQDGSPIAGKGCKCAAGKVTSRNANNIAICVPKKPPLPPPPPRGSCPGTYGRSVKIDSAPQGAKISDAKTGCVIGTTPWSGKLPDGENQLVVELTGYDRVARAFRIETTGQIQELWIPLSRMFSVDIRGDADPNVVGAAVAVDGQAWGTAPLVVRVSSGRHLVEVTKPGFEKFSIWVDLSTNANAVLTPTLKSTVSVGRILVDADVPTAEVYVDGNKHQDATPTIIQDVPVGPHVLEVRKNGKTAKQVVQVVAGQQVKYHAELASAAAGTVRVISDTAGARAFLDGVDAGPTPVDIRDVSVGEHIIQVKATGFVAREDRVTVAAGSSSIVKLDLVAASTRVPPTSPAAPTALSTPPVPAALAALDKSCRNNDRRACNDLGIAWSEGKNGAPRIDHTHARYYYDRGCKLSSGVACFNYANVNRLGEGVAVDLVAAMRYFQMACDLDEARGCTELAIMYFEGQVVEKNREMALKLSEKSCRLGSQAGCKNVEAIKKK